MAGEKKVALYKNVAFVTFGVAVALVAVSAFDNSAFLAITGIALIFWTAIILYITPVKHVPLTWLNASIEATSDNLERILTETNLTQKGIYLPPNSLKNVESSLVFVPETPNTPLPNFEETGEQLRSRSKNGLLITPPGYPLSRLFEEQLKTSFTKTDLEQLQNNLPKLLIEEFEIAQDIEIQLKENTITIELTNNILLDSCKQTDNHPRTHTQVGCLLSSALACILAKASGKPITIQSEIRTPETNVLTIEYQIKEE